MSQILAFLNIFGQKFLIFFWGGLDEVNYGISLSTANRILNKFIGKPHVIRRVFYLKPFEKTQRVQFCKFMKKNKIGPENIFLQMKEYSPCMHI